MAGICGKCGGNIQDSIGECVACLHRRIAELKVDRENAVTLMLWCKLFGHDWAHERYEDACHSTDVSYQQCVRCGARARVAQD